MKKRKDWIRKADKRKKKKKDRGVVDFVKITYHFFSGSSALDQRAGRPQESILYYLYTGRFCLDGPVKKYMFRPHNEIYGGTV